MKITLIVIINLFLFFSGFAAGATDIAATLTVTKISDTNDGVCDADCSLREAVSAANSGDTIVFSPLFNQPQTILLTNGQISISKSLTIAGPSADLLAVSGNDRSRIFHISNNAVIALSGMRLRDGRADGAGGAIVATDSTLTLASMTLNNNSAGSSISGSPNDFGYGAAVYSDNGSLSIIGSTISNNHAPNGAIYSRLGIVDIINSKINNNSGGGVYGIGSITDTRFLINVANSTFDGNNSGSAIAGSLIRIFVANSIITNTNSGISSGISNGSGGTLIVDRSIISNNSSSGIANYGTATITKTTIDNNSDETFSGNGGGIYNTRDMIINDSTISNNKSGRTGGGIFNAGRLTLTNSTVSGNFTALYSFGNGAGGGIYNTSIGDLILTNSTVTNNRATGNGGGLRHDSSGTVTLRNTIIAGNSTTVSGVLGKDVFGAFVSQGFNLIGDVTGGSGWIASDLLNRNPLLVPLGYNGGLTLTHALMPTSPAIDAGSNDLAVDPATNSRLSRDQRGYARSGSNIVDIGAFESGGIQFRVGISGRVLTADGRGIYQARIVVTDSFGTVFQTQTNPFGYYRFVNVPQGITYTITIIHKRYKFNSPLTITIDNDRSNLNFIAAS